MQISLSHLTTGETAPRSGISRLSQGRGLLVYGFLALLVGVGSAPAQQSDHQIRASEANELGVAAFKAADYREAVDQFERARQLHPQNDVFTSNLAKALHARGLGYLQDGALKRAEADARRATELDGKEDAFPDLLCRVLMKAELYDEARVVAERAIRKHAESASLYETLGRLAYQRDDLEGALKSLKKASTLDPKARQRLSAFIKKVEREVEVEARFFKDHRAPYTVKYDDSSYKAMGSKLLLELDRVGNQLSQDLGLAVPRELTVILYSRKDYDQATGASGWTGGLFDGKVRIPVQSSRGIDPGLLSTLRHEMTHWMVREAAPHCPLWLNEGLAQVSEGRQVNRLAAAALKERKNKGTLKAIADLPDNWSKVSDAKVVSIYYAESLSFTRFLKNRYGLRALRELLVEFRQDADLNAVFQKVLRRDLKDLEAAWRDEL